MHLTSGDIIIMGDSKYTELSLPLCSESGSKSSRGKRTAAKLIAGISGLVIFGYFMSATYFSTPESSAINLNSSGARLQELVDQYQLELVSTPEKVSEFGDQGPFTILAMSKDNSLAALGNDESGIEVWNVQKKELVAKFHSDTKIAELLFTPDGKYLISFTESKQSGFFAQSNSYFKIWDLTTISLYGQIENESRHKKIFVTSDSKFIFYASSKEISFWDITKLTKSHSIKIRDDSYIVDIAVTPDSKYLAISISGGVTFIRVYDVNTRKKIATINNDIGDAYSLMISDDGKTVINQYIPGKYLSVWNAETGSLITNIELESGARAPNLSPDGRFLYLANYSFSNVYDLKANKTIWVSSDFIYESAFTKDSKYLLVHQGIYVIKVIALETSKEVATLDHNNLIEDLYLSENGEYLLVSTSKSASLWSLSNLYN
jgi:WD40 repeat protein